MKILGRGDIDLQSTSDRWEELWLDSIKRTF